MRTSNVAFVQQITYTAPMTEEKVLVPALGGYLKTLRARKGLTQAKLIRELKDIYGITPDRSTIRRAERGVTWPDSGILTAFMGIVGGSMDDLVWIRSNPDASVKDGVERAETWLRNYGKAEDVEAIIEASSEIDADEIAADLEELAQRVRGGKRGRG